MRRQHINTDLHISFSCPYYILFSSNVLSQQEYGFMADITATIAKRGYDPSCAMTCRKRDPGKSLTVQYL